MLHVFKDKYPRTCISECMFTEEERRKESEGKKYKLSKTRTEPMF